MLSDCKACCISVEALTRHMGEAMLVLLVVILLGKPPVIQVIIEVWKICSVSLVVLMAECRQMWI